MTWNCLLPLAVLVATGALADTSCGTPDRPPAAQSAAGYEVGVRPRALAVADFNGDGLPDVAVANSGDGTVSILVGSGAGRRLRLAPGTPIAGGREPSDVDAADLDRDGDFDLALANHETSRVTILLNDGRAGFTPARGSPLETGARPHVHGLATGDFDGDGWPDVAVDSADTREVRILRGGPGGFGAAAAAPLMTKPYFRLGAADVTGDGRPEVLVPGQDDSTVRVVQREGAGWAQGALSIQLTEKPWMVVGADVSGDGRADIIVTYTDAVSIWLGGRDGFAQAPGSPFQVRGATEVAAGDLDGDGVADVAVGPWDGDEVTLLKGGALSVRKVRTCERPIGLAVADMDGDRKGELLAACANQNRLLVLTAPLSR